MKIFIVIPVHNRKALTRNCLVSLQNQSYKDFKIVIIDDGSTDGTYEMLRAEFPESIVFISDGHLWWTKATNIGVRYALEKGAASILTLNDDTVATPNFLETMNYWAEKQPEALLGAFALNAETERPYYGGEIINWKTAGTTMLLDVLKPEEYHGLHAVSHYPGRGLLIPSSVFKTIGFYDEKHFPQAVADDDLVHRAVRAGYKVYCNYDAKLLVFPAESGDVKLRSKKSFKNYCHHLFSIKGGGNLKLFSIYAIKNCPKEYLILFLPLGILRRIFGYLIDWASETVQKMSGATKLQ
jgi:GT2 family glycosyltransferase